MKRFLTWLCSFLLISYASAQVIPDSLRADWSVAGLQNFYVDTNVIADVTLFGATGNGVTNDYPAVASAITSLAGHSGIVYFPPGNYRINSTLSLPDSVVLEGAGSSQTTLTFDLGGVTGNCINAWAAQTHPFFPLRDGFRKGSFQLVCDSAVNFSAGEVVELREQNGAWDTNPAFWADYSVGQILNILSINGDTLFLEHALRLDFDSILHPEIRKVVMRNNTGIHCLHILRTDSTAPGLNYGIYFAYAANGQVRGVEMEHTIGAMIWAEASTALEITGNYFHHAYDYSGSSTMGYGVVMAVHTGESKIENNIFRHLRHAMMVKQGANGNVFGYNYSLEPTRTEFPSDFGGDLSLHGHYPFANLFEGNISQNLMLDQAYGPAGPYNTFFRNRLELYGLVISNGTVTTDKNNFVGNDITGTGLGQGQYLLTGSAHLQYGNRDNGVLQPPGTAVLPDTSYYLAATPAFWNITDSFPNIGTPHLLTGQDIPALSRFLAGAPYTICGEDVPTSVHPVSMNEAEVSLSPNPASGALIITTKLNRWTSVDVVDVMGKTWIDQPVIGLCTTLEVRFLPRGFYFIVLRDKAGNQVTRKMVKE